MELDADRDLAEIARAIREMAVPAGEPPLQPEPRLLFAWLSYYAGRCAAQCCDGGPLDDRLSRYRRQAIIRATLELMRALPH